MNDRTDLLLYDLLGPDERQQADAYLAAHPEAWELVERGRALRALAASLTDDDLAAAVLARASGDPSLGPLTDRVEEARRAAPALDARYRELEGRLGTVLEGVPAPEAHLAALSVEKADGAPARRGPDRPAARAPSRWRWAASSLIAVMALAALVFALTRAGEPAGPPGERLAALAALPASFEGPNLRGGGEAAPLPGTYDAALRAVHAARRPDGSYDPEALRTARASLLDVSTQDPDGAIGLEARFAAGRVALHLGEHRAAREDLRAVVRQEGPSAPEASDLLAEMDRQGLG